MASARITVLASVEEFNNYIANQDRIIEEQKNTIFSLERVLYNFQRSLAVKTDECICKDALISDQEKQIKTLEDSIESKIQTIAALRRSVNDSKPIATLMDALVNQISDKVYKDVCAKIEADYRE